MDMHLYIWHAILSVLDTVHNTDSDISLLLNVRVGRKTLRN